MAWRALCNSIYRRRLRVPVHLLPRSSAMPWPYILPELASSSASFPFSSPRFFSIWNPTTDLAETKPDALEASSHHEHGDIFDDNYAMAFMPDSLQNAEEAVHSFSGTPVDMVIAILDGMHNIGGMPWWITIVDFTICTRMLLLPLVILQQKRVTKIVALLPQILIPTRGSERSIKEQFSLLVKKCQELNCPNPLWFIATPVLQIALFLATILAVRRMALEKYPGFDCGGMLWFTDLTISGHGALGALLPLVIATIYLANIKVSFKDAKFSKTKAGSIFLFWSWWLEASSVLVFGVGLYLPQAAQIYLVASNMCNLIQNVWLNRFRAQFISELRTHGASTSSRSSDQISHDAYDTLLLAAARNLADHQLEKAIDLFKSALKENPERPEAYGSLGHAYLSKKQFSEAEEYYRHAIAKGRTTEFLIAAYSGIASALFQQEKLIECIANLKIVRSFDVPEDPHTRFSYYQALVMLASALSRQGMKVEALEVLNEAAAYDKNISRYIEELQKQIGRK